MYYYQYQNRPTRISRIFLAFLILSLCAITYQHDAFADIKQKSAEQYRVKGYEAQQKGDLEKALSFYVKAAELDPSAAVYNDMGVVYEQLGLMEKAEGYYLEALKLDDRYLPSYSNLAYLYERQGHRERAAQYFKKRIEWGDPNDVWTIKAREQLARLGKGLPHIETWLLEQDVCDLARRRAQQQQQTLQSDIVRATELYTKGLKLAKKKQYSRAIMQYNQALALTPENPKITRARDHARLEVIKEKVKEHADRAQKMLNLGDTQSAAIEFRKILTIIPDEPIRISK